eukprot:1851262-Pyramimonas_sp.AAC.1
MTRFDERVVGHAIDLDIPPRPLALDGGPPHGASVVSGRGGSRPSILPHGGSMRALAGPATSRSVRCLKCASARAPAVLVRRFARGLMMSLSARRY